jgi:ribosomal-protein-alanine N-acetyltransferase
MITVDTPLDGVDTPLDGVDTPLDGIVVGPMKRRHLRAVTAIERVANPHPWSHSLFAGELRMPTSRHWLVARDSRQVVGFAGLMWNLDEGHITNFAVHGDHRRCHVATRMLLAQCRDAINLGVTQLSLEVRVSNEPARALYGRFGFGPGGVRRGYYNDNGEDALIMWVHDIDGAAFGERIAGLEAAMPVQLVREAL